MKKQLIIVGAVFVVVVLTVLFLTKASDTNQSVTESAIPENDPIDVALEFYNDWLEAVQSTTTDPYAAGLTTDVRLNEASQTKLAESNIEVELDPVLCQVLVPERIGAKVSYTLEREAQLLILARGLAEKSGRQAVVDLVAENGEWVIAGITCTEGESAPEREFTFERDGFLLKSVPPPLNPEYWHLVFEERGVPGHTTPLFFSEDSVCVSITGEEAVCDTDTLQEATAATVKGQMTESGVNVSRIELVVSQ